MELFIQLVSQLICWLLICCFVGQSVVWLVSQFCLFECLFVCCGNMSSITISILVEFFHQVCLMLAIALKRHDNRGMRLVLCAVFSEISEYRTGPQTQTKGRFAFIFQYNYNVPRYSFLLDRVELRATECRQNEQVAVKFQRLLESKS